MSMQIQLGPEAFRFTTFQQWVDKAQSWFAARIPAHAKAGRRYLCIDAVGRVCLIGKDFMRARDEQTFPIMVFLIDAEAPAGVNASDEAAKLIEQRKRLGWSDEAIGAELAYRNLPTAGVNASDKPQQEGGA